MDGVVHERFYLSAGRSPASAAASLPLRWPRLAGRLRGADLLHVHGDAASVIALPLLRVRPAVITTHGLHLFRRSSGLGGAAMTWAMRRVTSSSRAVICTSAAERDELAAVVRPSELGKLRVIHNGIDPPPVSRPSEREEVRNELGLGHETVLGLFAGQLEERKAPLIAAAAARRVRAAGTPFVLAVAGEGPLADELKRDGDSVRILGYRRDLPRLLAAADIFIAPAEREGMSLALLEAMASGIAVIAASGPGNPEAVGDTALQFRAGDEDGLVDALTVLSGDVALRADLGARAKARALEHFSAARFVAETASVYRQAVGAITVPGPDAGGGHA
jgi:glycosyltransferase involved in cell wall biosynthesis